MFDDFLTRMLMILFYMLKCLVVGSMRTFHGCVCFKLKEKKHNKLNDLSCIWVEAEVSETDVLKLK